MMIFKGGSVLSLTQSVCSSWAGASSKMALSLKMLNGWKVDLESLIRDKQLISK